MTPLDLNQLRALAKAGNECAVQECERPKWCRGLCTMHYERMRRNGDPLKLRRTLTLMERFWKRVDKSGECWKWQSPIANGYGKFYINSPRGLRLAHRWIYEQLVGPIPDGYHIDHICRTKNCVRIDHLRPLPAAENCRLGHRAGGWTADSRDDIRTLIAAKVTAIRVRTPVLIKLLAEAEGK